MFSIRRSSSSHGQISKQFLNLIHFSTKSQPQNHHLLQPNPNPNPNHFLEEYLIKTLNFTPQEAIAASSKVRHLKSPKHSQSVINFLKSYNLSIPQIKSIVQSQPTILLRKIDKTLNPKFKLLSEIGFSGSELVFIIKKDPNLLVRSLITSIIPTINLLRKYLRSNENIVIAMKKSHWPFYGRNFRNNVVLLERYGVSSKDIERVIVRNPRMITQSPVRLEEKLMELEKVFGITPCSSMFSYGFSAICAMNKMNLLKKFELFRSFGWCDEDIFMVSKSQPICFTHSEERLRKGLRFFMEELGYSGSWLSTRGCLLMYSLEKRVKPRYSVYKVLKEKGVLVKEFHSMLCLSDVDFVKHVVRHKEDMPRCLYDNFTKHLEPK